MTKVLELLIRARLKSLILEKQNGLQRGCVENSSSQVNTALILEDYIRDRRDIQDQAYMAFDVVSHKILMRKLFILVWRVTCGPVVFVMK